LISRCLISCCYSSTGIDADARRCITRGAAVAGTKGRPRIADAAGATATSIALGTEGTASRRARTAVAETGIATEEAAGFRTQRATRDAGTTRSVISTGKGPCGLASPGAAEHAIGTDAANAAVAGGTAFATTDVAESAR
jgi:hypothetical protein